MPLLDVQTHDLLKQLVEGLANQQRSVVSFEFVVTIREQELITMIIIIIMMMTTTTTTTIIIIIIIMMMMMMMIVISPITITSKLSDLVGVCHNECPLIREVMIDVGYDLHCHISFSSTWWSNHHGETGLHARSYGLHLGFREGDLVPVKTMI